MHRCFRKQRPALFLTAIATLAIFSSPSSLSAAAAASTKTARPTVAAHPSTTGDAGDRPPDDPSTDECSLEALQSMQSMHALAATGSSCGEAFLDYLQGPALDSIKSLFNDGASFKPLRSQGPADTLTAASEGHPKADGFPAESADLTPSTSNTSNFDPPGTLIAPGNLIRSIESVSRGNDADGGVVVPGALQRRLRSGGGGRRARRRNISRCPRCTIVRCSPTNCLRRCRFNGRVRTCNDDSPRGGSRARSLPTFMVEVIGDIRERQAAIAGEVQSQGSLLKRSFSMNMWDLGGDISGDDLILDGPGDSNISGVGMGMQVGGYMEDGGEYSGEYSEDEDEYLDEYDGEGYSVW